MERGIFGTGEDPLTDEEVDHRKKKGRGRRSHPYTSKKGQAVDEDGKPSAWISRSIEREMVRLGEKAKENRGELPRINLMLRLPMRPSVHFDFDFSANVKKRTSRVPKEVQTWEDDEPRVAMSSDNVLLAAYLPKAVHPRGQVSLPPSLSSGRRADPIVYQEEICKSLEEFAEKVPPHANKTQKAKVKGQSYKKTEGQRWGEHRLVRGWHALGQNVSGTPHAPGRHISDIE